MIEEILERFKEGEYDSPNGAKLFVMDMEAAKIEVDDLKEQNNLLEMEVEDLN